MAVDTLDKPPAERFQGESARALQWLSRGSISLDGTIGYVGELDCSGDYFLIKLTRSGVN